MHSILDDFILQLILDDSRKMSDHEVYLYLYHLVFEPELDVDVEELQFPYYPYLITMYHLVFVKGDMRSARKLFEKVEKEYSKSHARFSEDEVKMLEMLGLVLKHTSWLFRKSCEELRDAIAKIDVNKDSWAYFFKHLILAQLGSKIDYNVKLEFNGYKNSLVAPVDYEVAQHFNIPSSSERTSRVIDYLAKEFDRVEKECEIWNSKNCVKVCRSKSVLSYIGLFLP